MFSKNLNYSEPSDDSGARRIPRDERSMEDLMADKKEQFERMIFEMEMDRKFGVLFKMGGFTSKENKGGMLRSVIDDLQKFEDKYLSERNYIKSGEERLEEMRKIQSNFDEESSLENLRKIFVRAMEKIVANWSVLGRQQYDWQEIAEFMSGKFGDIARLMGFGEVYQGHMNNWFIRYSKDQQAFEKRDKLNEEALTLEQQLAYYRSNGATKNVINETRSRLENINKQLEELPADPNAAPAFSKFNPNQKTHIDSPYLKEKGKTVGQKMTETESEKKVGGLRGFLKKIPLLGRWF
jgi:hypothetical protein